MASHHPHPLPLPLPLPPVCCLCGDVGFPANLFRCTLCSHRFQHSYCSNYYGESAEAIEVCDWCRCERRCGRRGSAARKFGVASQKSSGQDKRERNSGGMPSPRVAPRRYKLLKDVMC
ncbi:uncharacterized protein LOC111472884 isoform X2 [Cucurbita maxima]|uniref:Uncharacterized protein LOC111472884 isoform X2 n=1 Tax=Cucurbita maxima TaxID=3661 RepID=A0A6J1IAU2_CUCMA|nr:uncharacterized protein LOC111472884 isoform X2 [Cucurbita maxima]